MTKRKQFRLKLRSETLVLGERTLIMGVLNVTPDSFSDGGKYHQPEIAAEHALRLETAGADLLDIGGESTRPGAEETSDSEELDRLLPVLEGLRGRLKIPVSVDTRRSAVAELALELAHVLRSRLAMWTGGENKLQRYHFPAVLAEQLLSLSGNRVGQFRRLTDIFQRIGEDKGNCRDCQEGGE